MHENEYMNTYVHVICVLYLHMVDRMMCSRAFKGFQIETAREHYCTGVIGGQPLSADSCLGRLTEKIRWQQHLGVCVCGW